MTVIDPDTFACMSGETVAPAQQKKPCDKPRLLLSPVALFLCLPIILIKSESNNIKSESNNKCHTMPDLIQDAMSEIRHILGSKEYENDAQRFFAIQSIFLSAAELTAYLSSTCAYK